MIQKIRYIIELCQQEMTAEIRIQLNYEIKLLTRDLKKALKISVNRVIDELENYYTEIEEMIYYLNLLKDSISIKTTYHYLYLIIKEILNMIKYREFVHEQNITDDLNYSIYF